MEQAEEEVLVAGVDAPGDLRIDARGPLAGDPGQDVAIVGCQVNGDADVPDPRRIGPRAPAGHRVHGPYPAAAQQPAELQHRRVEPLDMANLEGDATASCRSHEEEALLDGGGEGLFHEDRQAPFNRRGSELDVGRGRRRDDHGVELRLVDHRQRIGPATGVGALASGSDRARIRIANRDEPAIGARRKVAEVVPPHRPQAGEPDTERGSHQAELCASADGATGRATSRIAVITASSSSGVRFGRTGTDSTSSERRFVTGRSSAAAPGTKS